MIQEIGVGFVANLLQRVVPTLDAGEKTGFPAKPLECFACLAGTPKF
jgi:hypothetical protein